MYLIDTDIGIYGKKWQLLDRSNCYLAGKDRILFKFGII